MAADASINPAVPQSGISGFWLLVRQAFSAWVDDYAPSMGAALSYYTLFSLAPLLLLVVAVAGLVFGEEAARGEIAAQLSTLVGQDGAEAVEGILKSANRPGGGFVASVVGVFTLVLGATSVLAELQSALDRIWEVPAKPGTSGLWTMLRSRLLSLGFILSLAFLLLVSLALSAGLAALGKWSGQMIPGWETVLQIVNFVVSFGITTVLFAVIYRLLPRARVQWNEVWIGALATAALFNLGKLAIGLYLGKMGVASGFGAAGSLVVLLVWVYYSAQIFLLGAEFTWVYANRHGSRGSRGPASGG